MNKLIGFFFVVGALFVMAQPSQAASARGGAKPTVAITYVTNVVGISSGPATLYSVYMSTGAVGDFIALFDSNSIVGLSATSTTNLKTRVFAVSSTTLNTSMIFDPPLIFKNGLIATQSSGVDQSLIVYEKGIALQQ